MTKYNVTVDGGNTIEIAEDRLQSMDWIPSGTNSWHVLEGKKSFKVAFVSLDKRSKQAVLKVNGVKHSISIADSYDLLVKKMGLSATVMHKVDEIKAPMPGLVLEIMVKEGQTIHEGDPLLILEAMKMENVLKSPGAGIVDSIKVEKGAAVDKGAILIKLQ